MSRFGRHGDGGHTRASTDAFPCPCGGGFDEVIDTRTSKGRVRRRRQCRSCETRITTYEVVGPDPPDRVLSIALSADLEEAIDRLG